jgi:hypothetical protein
VSSECQCCTFYFNLKAEVLRAGLLLIRSHTTNPDISLK